MTSFTVTQIDLMACVDVPAETTTGSDVAGFEIAANDVNMRVCAHVYCF